MNTEILLGVGMFTAIIMVLVTVILMARKQLVAAGAVDIEINGDPIKPSAHRWWRSCWERLRTQGFSCPPPVVAVGLAVSVVAGGRGRWLDVIHRGGAFYARGSQEAMASIPARQRSNKI